MRLPWFKFSPDAWASEPNLKLVSRAARSLWVDLMCIAHRADPYGHVVIEGVKPSFADLAKIHGDSEKDIFRLIGELVTKRVCSVTEDGIIYSRKMVRDFEKAEKDKANGKGGGNPKLIGEDNGGVNPRDNLPDNGVVKDKSIEGRAESLEPKQNSEANASAPAARPEPDFKREVWKTGKKLKIAPAALGEMGKLCAQDWAALMELLARCEANAPIDPTSWCFAELRPAGHSEATGPPAKKDKLTLKIEELDRQEAAKKANGHGNGGRSSGLHSEPDARALQAALRR